MLVIIESHATGTVILNDRGGSAGLQNLRKGNDGIRIDQNCQQIDQGIEQSVKICYGTSGDEGNVESRKKRHSQELAGYPDVIVATVVAKRLAEDVEQSAREGQNKEQYAHYHHNVELVAAALILNQGRIVAQDALIDVERGVYYDEYQEKQGNQYEIP
jgi:hypothetical protein